MGDVEVLLQFARLVEAAFEPEQLARAVVRAMKAPARPPGLPEGMLEAMPDAHGVYLFYAAAEPAPAGRRETPLYVGRAASLRARVGEHFAASLRKGKAEADLGRYRVTGRDEDRHVFKVPSLRNVALTAPYFHDGSAATLDEAIRVMARYQLGREIGEDDRRLIAAFLESLTGRVAPRATR